MLNPKHKLWRWGPIDGRPVYADAWYDGQTANRKLIPPGWPPNYSLYKGERYLFVCDQSNLDKNSVIIFNKYVMPDRALRRWYLVWQDVVRQFVTLNKHILNTNIKNLTSKELYELIKRWYKHYSLRFWGVGLLPEIANLGGEAWLRHRLEYELPPTANMNQVMERLSAPEKISFYQQEEMDLLRLKQVRNQALLKRKLVRHQQRYYWILNSYHDTCVLDITYFSRRLCAHTKKQAQQKLRWIRDHLRATRQQKLTLVRQFSLSNKILKTAHRLAFCIWWQDNRKSYIFQANHVIDVMLNELSRRYKVSPDYLHWYTSSDILNLARIGTGISSKELSDRKKYFTVLWRPAHSVRYFSGMDARRIYTKFLTKHVSRSKAEIAGQAVSSGEAKGRVRIILSPKQSNKMKKGEVLVTTMTSPDFIVAMHKAVAIVTDVGGITSHAAIVSRELKIPCIVGTNIATKVLKDGDLVEVDAIKGMVRKL